VSKGRLIRSNLPMDLLRSFVTIADMGSMARASEHIFLTQSALSLQMKRLADIVQQPLFRRHQGATVLTPTGEILLGCAREILALNDRALATIGGRLTGPARIGMVQDFADVILSSVLADFKRLNPDTQMEISVSNSIELKDLIAADLLDIALYLGDISDNAAVATADMAWLGDAKLLDEPVLPIAIMTRPCLFRDAAIGALEVAGRRFSIVLETPSLSVLRASVEGGLAITCRTSGFLGHRFAALDVGVSPLPKISYCLGARHSAPPTIASLAGLIRGAVVNL